MASRKKTTRQTSVKPTASASPKRSRASSTIEVAETSEEEYVPRKRRTIEEEYDDDIPASVKKFQWSKYPYLETIIRNSGVTSTTANKEFWTLYGEINAAQNERGAPEINKEKLQVHFYSR
jgi:hypothetical protein